MSFSTKRRARRAAAYIAACFALLVLPVASCSDRGITQPTSRLTPSGAAFSAALSLNTRVIYLGAPNSQPINFIRARVYDESGATIGSVEQNLDPTKSSFDFSLSVQLPGARSTKSRMTLELANRGPGGEIVQYSGRIQSLPLAPGDFRQVDIDLYPGPLDNFDVRGVRIAKPIRDIVDGDSVVATATVDGGSASTRVIWSSLDAAIATIDNGGKIRGVSAGVARVVAAVGTLADTASVKVLAKRAGVIVTPPVLEVSKVGDIGVYTATVVDKNGSAIAGEPVLWSIADPSIGSFVSTATVQGMRVGQTTVTARAANDTSLHGSAIFRVKPQDARVARLEVSPSTATLRAVGATQTFVATARDSAGNVVPNVSVSWSSSASGVATISQGGVATAVARGTTSIVATVDAVTGSASLEVNPSASDLKLVGGDAQTDTVGRPLPLPFAVRTVDRAGNAVAGVPVEFSAADGASISVTNATSNSEGIAQTQVTLGRTPGVYRVSARADSLAGSPITISATAVNGAPFALEIERQPSSPAQNRVALATQPIVRVVDAFGNRALRATPMITATPDSGTADGNTAAVNAGTGLATYSGLSLGGRIGDRNITFSSGSLRPVTTRVTLVAGAPATITPVSGAVQVGQAGTAVSTVPSVRVLDVDGNPVDGATVTFAVTSGNGAIVNVTVTTDANGIASVGGWTLGTTAGANTLTATVDNLTTTFTATGTAGTPSSTGSTMNVSATTTTAGSATPITVTIQLRDGNGNALTTSGGIVAIASTLGTVSTVVDNNNGTYTATLTVPQTVGTALLTATLGGQPLTSSATVVIEPGAPSATTTTVAVGGTSLNANGTTTITITVRDAYGNIVTNVTPSSLALSSSIGTIGTVTCTNGVCTATYTAPASSGTAAIGVTVGGTAVASTPSIAVSAVAGVVTGLTATRGDAQVSLSWTAPASNGLPITDYFIEYKPTAGSTWAAFSHPASTATAAAVTGLTNGTSYDFRVSAINGVGTGPTSSIATATPATTAGAPTSLAATAGASQVSLTWTAPNDGGSPITDYLIEYSTDGTNWTTFAHGASTATNIVVTGLTNGTAYRFRVSAVNAIGTSTPSSSVNETPTLGGTPHLAINGGNNQTATAGSAVATAPSVKAIDANNNPVQGVSVTFTVASGGGSVTGGSVTTDASGIATVGGWTLGTTAGANSLTASASGYTSATFNATGAVGAASTATSTISASPTSLTANGSATSALTVRLKDANGNNLTTGGASVSFVAPSVGSIGTVTDNNDGTYTATYTAGSTPGTVTIQPKLGGADFTNTATISLTVGAATQLALTTSASGAVSGVAFTTQPVVQICDASNNLVAGSTANVTMSVSANGVVVGTSTVAAINGVATFSNVGIAGTAGTSYTLTFASASLTSATQLITPTAGTPSQLAIVTAASGAVNGAAFGTQPVIEIQDAFGNRTTSTTTVTLGVSTGATTLGTVSVAAVSGRATFTDAGITGTAGTPYTLTYSATSLASTTQSITPTIGADAALALTTNAAGAASGAAFTTQPVVEIRDAQGARTASTANVTMTVSTGGTVVGTATVAAVSGIATFTNVGISGLVSGSPYTLTFASGSLTSTTQTIALVAGTPAKLAIVTAAANATNGSAFATQPVIEIQDAQGNRTASTATVSIGTSSGSTLSGTTNVAAVNGRATFAGVGISGTLGTAYTLTYTSSGLTQITQSITPTVGTATQLALTTNASGAASGAAFSTQPVVQIRDANDNVVTGSTANVTMSVSANGVVVGTSTVAAVDGVATFTNVGIAGTAGTSYTLTFASASLTPATQLITPTAGAAAKLSLVTSAADAVNGASFGTQPVVEIQDSFGNRTSGTATVVLDVSSGATTFGAVSVTASGGRVFFTNAGIDGTVGTAYTLTYSSAGLASVTQSITPTAGAPTHLALVTYAAGSASGAAFVIQPVLEIRSANGDVASGSTASVTMTVSANGTTVGTTTVAAVNGVATFTDVGISGTSGTSYTITFASSGLTSMTQSITPTAGAAAKLAVSTAASGVVNGSAFSTQPVIEIQDAFGNRTTSTATVAIGTSAGSTLSGTTSVTAVNGRATFTNLAISGTAGTSYTLTYTSSGLTQTTQTITPTAGTATQLALTTSASGAVSGAAFTTQPVVQIRDAGNNVVTGSTANVTMSVSSNGVVVGTSTVAAINGVATFSSVGISGTAGTSYTLTFASAGLTSATQWITPTAGAAAKLSIVTAAASAVNGSAFGTQPVIEIQDAFGNRTTSTASVTLDVSTGATTVGTVTVAAVSGRATFTNVGITGTAGTAYTLTYSSPSLSSTTQSITPAVGADAALALTTNAAVAASGAAFTTQPVVEIHDAQGTRTSSTASVTMTVSAGGTVVGTATVAAVNGVATFTNVGISGLVSGSPYTLTFASGSLTSTTQTIALDAGTPAKFAIITSAAGATSGAAFSTQPVIEIQDAAGNRTTSTATVAMAVNLNATTVGTVSIAAIDGRATFTDVGISGAAGTSYTLTFSSVGLTSATQSITPTAGAADASQSTLSIGATTLGANGTTTITITVKDAFGNVVTNASSSSFTLATDLGTIGAVSCTNGVCTATFTAPGSAGTAKISAKIDGTDLSGSPATVTIATVAGAPTGLSATSNQDRQVPLTWTAPASNGGAAITDYLVEYSVNAGSSWNTFAHGASTATSITVTGLTNGTLYTFRVSAINGVGTSSASGTATATPAGSPDAPTNLLATPGTAQAALTWTAPANNGGSTITDYVIEYSSNGGTSWTTFPHAASPATSITVTGLTNGTSYTFRVSAKNANGTGAASTTTTATPGAPGAPTNLGAALNQVTATSHTAALTWTAPASNGGSAVTDYVIEYKPTSSATWNVVTHSPQTATSYSLTGLVNSTSYDFRVAAKNSVGTGPYSTTASATTTGPSERLQCQTAGNSNANSTTASVLPCSGVKVGDIIVIPVAITNAGSAKTITSNDGFTALTPVQNGQDTQNYFQTTVFYKIATAADVGRATAYSFTWSGNEKSIVTLVAYKNVDGSAPSMTSSTGMGATMTAPTGPAVATQSHTLLYFYLQNIALSSTTPSISEWTMTTGGSNGPSDLFKNTTAGANNANAIGVLTADIDKFTIGATSTVENAKVTTNSANKAWTAIVLGIHP